MCEYGEDKLKQYIGDCTQPKLKMSGSLRKPPRYLCFDYGTPTPCLREAGNGVVGRLVYVLAGISIIVATKSCKILFVRIASHFIAQAGSIALFDQSN